MKELNSEKMVCHGHEVEIIYRGTGRFEKIVMYDEEDVELYYVHKVISGLSAEEDYLIERREVFEGTLRRTYKGWRNSFIEFCRETANLKSFPKTFDYYPVMRKLRLSLKSVIIYAAYYEKFFRNEK